MRRHLTATLGIALLAGLAQAGIVGSKHDLTSSGGSPWSGSNDQVCIYCHTPHNASTVAPLWNRNLPTQTFTPYSSYTFDGTFVEPAGQPTAESLLCLSCHDGVTALNSLLHGSSDMVGGFDQLGDVYYPGSPYTSGMGANIGENFPGSGGSGYEVDNLSNDHPVSFIFDQALVDTDAAGGPVKLVLPTSGSPIRLFGAAANRLECSSCHNVHDDAIEPFLVRSNTGSALCLTCHLR
jgi:predicted CXXCH cytochrome family protein